MRFILEMKIIWTEKLVEKIWEKKNDMWNMVHGKMEM